MRILIVEDDAEAAAAMVRGLAEAGHECDHAADGAMGLSRPRDGGFDVMVVDRMTPSLDGLTHGRDPARARATRRRCCSCPRWARSRTGSPA